MIDHIDVCLCIAYDITAKFIKNYYERYSN